MHRACWWGQRTLVYACEKIGGVHDQNIIFAPPDVGWLKSHATAERQLHTAIIEVPRRSDSAAGVEPAIG